jgi:hypothetical protein
MSLSHTALSCFLLATALQASVATAQELVDDEHPTEAEEAVAPTYIDTLWLTDGTMLTGRLVDGPEGFHWLADELGSDPIPYDHREVARIGRATHPRTQLKYSSEDPDPLGQEGADGTVLASEPGQETLGYSFGLAIGNVNASLHGQVEIRLHTKYRHGGQTRGERLSVFGGVDLPASDVEAHEIGPRYGVRWTRGRSHDDPFRRVGHAVCVEAWYGAFRYSWSGSAYKQTAHGWANAYSSYTEPLRGHAAGLGYHLRAGPVRLRAIAGLGYSPRLDELGDESGVYRTVSLTASVGTRG